MNCSKGCLQLSHDLNKQGCHYVIVDAPRCNGCGACFLMCPDLAIEIDKPDAGDKP
jgi:2-oxoglutarate ferredoxin oxidoreductase subunit delta